MPGGATSRGETGPYRMLTNRSRRRQLILVRTRQRIVQFYSKHQFRSTNKEHTFFLTTEEMQPLTIVDKCQILNSDIQRAGRVRAANGGAA